MTTVSVYALRDPRTDEVRYIGQSKDPSFRFKQHLTDFSDTPKGRWISELSEAGLEPKMEILESDLTSPKANRFERKWIAKAIRKGWPLTNQVINDEPVELNDFSIWLSDIIGKQDQSIRNIADQMGISHATVSRVLNGVRKPGDRFCIAVATTFHLPPERVFRKAGLLPPKPQSDDGAANLVATYHALDDRDRDTLLRIAQALAQRQVQEV